MTFCENFENIAHDAMMGIRPELANKYVTLMQFLAFNPASAISFRGKNGPPVGSEAYIVRKAPAFATARELRPPSRPDTVPDSMVSFILETYFDVPHADLDRIKYEHGLSMSAENVVGNLLESYIASVIEADDWIWCSGSVVKAVDFIKPPARVGDDWVLLQIKNRNNSENSSSSAIRMGTTIKKWFRTHSKTGATNWPELPCNLAGDRLSEDGFKDYVRQYLRLVIDA